MFSGMRIVFCFGLLVLSFWLVMPAASVAAPDKGQPDFGGIQSYLVGRSNAFVGELGVLRSRSDRYYALAKASRFDYARLWRMHRREVSALLVGLKPAFRSAHGAYEEEEGIIAGVPSLSEYDVIMDSGTSAADDPATAVPFDLRLPDGRVLRRPGNFFHTLLEPALWGTDARFVPRGGRVDLDRDGAVEFGEVLPDANVLAATMREFQRYGRESAAKAKAWEPNASGVFTALVVMVPTVQGYFGEWKSSRFISGARAREKAFVAQSRLVDVHGILFSLRNIYRGVAPLVAKASVAQSKQIAASLDSLVAFVDGIYAREKAGKRFTPAESDLLGTQAQRRANAIAGQIAQVAGVLGIKLKA